MKPHRRIGAAACLIALCCSCFFKDAHAEARFPSGTSLPETVVLVSLTACCKNAAWPAAEDRIQKELGLTALTVIVDAPAVRNRAPIDTLRAGMKRHAATGALLLEITPTDDVRLHLLFRHPGTDAPGYASFVLEKRPNEESDRQIELIAIKAQEAVLAALYEGRSSPATAAAPVQAQGNAASPSTTPPPQSVQTVAPRKTAANGQTLQTPQLRSPQTPSRHPERNTSRSPPPRSPHTALFPAYRQLRLRLGIAGSWSPGGIGPMGAVDGGVSVRLPHRLAVGADITAYLLAREVRTDKARASVDRIIGRCSAAFLLGRLGVIQPRFGVFAGAGYFWSKGESDTIPVKRSWTVQFAGGAFAEIALVLGNRLLVPIRFGAGALLPGVMVRFSGRSEAKLKVLMLETAVGLSVRL